MGVTGFLEGPESGNPDKNEQIVSASWIPAPDDVRTLEALRRTDPLVVNTAILAA